MLKKLSILALLLLSGCVGIPFCNDKGQPPGCHQWDPATKSGAASRS